MSDDDDIPGPGEVADDGSRFRCECCHRLHRGDDYYSVSLCNETGYGVVMCEACCNFAETILARQTRPSDRHPTQPTIFDDDGVKRFKKNEIVRRLLDDGPFDMNQIACMSFSEEDCRQFAQLIGYSVSGYQSLSYSTAIFEDTED